MLWLKPSIQRERVRTLTAALTLLAVSIALPASVRAAEKTTIAFAGKAVRAEIVKFVKGKNDDMQMQLKMDGVEQALPLRIFSPEDVKKCYALVLEPANAQLRLGMGDYFYNKELFADAENELNAVIKLDAKLKPKAEDLLRKVTTGKQIAAIPEAPRKTEDKKHPETPVAVADKPKPEKNPGEKMKLPGTEEGYDDPSGAGMVVGGDGAPRAEVPPRSEAQMKEFLDKRLAELKTVCGGDWRLIETKHFYCFANIPQPKHEMISHQWNEKLYELLCEVLKHKEGDKLWNNKLPIYYFDYFRQFQKFAVQIDHSPGAQMSGGYFSWHGREVHICIPFQDRYRTSPVRMDEVAHNTLFHEGTHAFLQLTGEDVSLSRWLHEGMAQFIEFWYDSEKNPDKKERVFALNQVIRENNNTLRSWEEMQERPMGGTDMEGYAYSWSRLEFFYRNFPNQNLPQMIKLIKSGKTEKEAIETVFKMPVERLEDAYKIWVKAAIKANFKFN